MLEEKERIKNELRGLADQERHSAVELEQSLRTDFDKRLAEELRIKAEEFRAIDDALDGGIMPGEVAAAPRRTKR